MKERIRFTTRSGSTYIIDRETMTWYRDSDHEIIGDPGDYYTHRLKQWPRVELDESVRLVDEVSTSGIITSPVVSIVRTGVTLPDGAAR